MSKTGVFLGFQPGVNLSNEGIGRLLAFLLKENNTENKDIVLFCPEWLKKSISLLMKDNNIPESKFEIVSTGSTPLGVRIKSFMTERQKSKKGRSRRSILINNLKYKIGKILKSGITDFFSTTNVPLVILKSLGYLIFLIALLPFLIFGAVIYLIYKLLKFGYKLSKKVIPFHFALAKIKLLSDGSKGRVYQIVIDAELARMTNIINKHKEIDSCYIPSLVWPQIKDLRCKKILAAPDIVFYDFPTQFLGFKSLHKKIRESIGAADHIVCYSDHVKFHHLIDKCGVKPENITVIKHANIDMGEHLRLTGHIKNQLTFEQNAKQIINEYILMNILPSHVLYNADFNELDCLIYSSQYRFHKNIFNLIKAVKIINKEMYGNVKLILTGDYRSESAIKEYIKNNHLENDIFIFYGISSKLLAALNSQSKLAVNPTLFEGGFPFTFSEAFSVGTPSIMSDIPVVNSEISDPALKEMMLFNPYDPYAIAQKIVSSLDNRQALLKAQQSLYNYFSERDWKTVAYEYNQVFNQSL